ncbi:MAG TPA: peptidoglycan-binding domain-containing protein [Candidatus Paceibacterota bacterium]
MKKVLAATGVAVLAIALVASAQGYTFSTNLTVGSTGPAVVALQTALIAQGYSIPSIASGAAAKGYFGAQTQAAVKAYQTAHGVPSTGFVGPLTRAALNGGAMATAPMTSCPAGYVCTPTGGTTAPVTGGTQGGITTPGVPGIMSVTAGPLSSSVLYVGQSMVPIMTIRVQAQYSDLDVQSLNLSLGNNTGFYNKLFNTIFVTDGTNVLSSQPVNSSTAVQNGDEYLLGVAGFHFIVPKGTYRDLVIKGSLNSSIDSAYVNGNKVPTSGNGLSNKINGTTVSGWGIGLQALGLRAVDGAGLNLYGPSTGIMQTFTINASLVDNAQANISLDSQSPLVANVPVNDTTNGQYLGLPVLIFDINAQNDTLHLRSVNVNFAVNGTGSVGAAYLYQGSTQIASASISGNAATFSNISNGTAGATIPVNTTVPFTVKVDVTGVSSGMLNVTASTSATQTILSSNDSTVTISGTAQGNTQTIASAGPLFTLVGSPTITKTQQVSGSGTDIVYNYDAVFTINIQAIGQNVLIGLPASTTAAGSASFGTTSTGNAIAQVYENEAASTTAISGGLAAVYGAPTNTTVTSGTYTISRNQSVTQTVHYSFNVINPGNKKYAVQLQGIYTNGSVLTNFMMNQPAWRTPSI